MFQEVLALLVVFLALGYAIYSVYRVVSPNKTKVTGCAGCEMGSCNSKK